MSKKILSVILVLLMAFTCLSLSVSAYSPSLESVFKAAFARYCDENGATIDEDNTLVEHIGSAGGYDVYRAYDDAVYESVSKAMGNYLFTHHSFGMTDPENPLGLYAFNGVELLPLEEAYEAGVADLDALYEKTAFSEMIPLNEEDELQLKCKIAFIENYNLTQPNEISGSDVTFAYEFEDYIVFGFCPEVWTETPASLYLDGYWLYDTKISGEDGNNYFYNPLGLYTLDNYGNIETLQQTVGKRFMDMDDIFPVIADDINIFVCGDINNDRKLTIKDATIIQKYLAKVPETLELVENHIFGNVVMETDEPFYNGATVNIKDATFIQKKLARIYEEDDSEPFSYEAFQISIWQKDAKEYTAEDFPEFEVEKISRFDSSLLDMTLLTVYLKNPGKSNVINAINSVKNRTEFSSVSACYPGTDA